MLKKHFIVFHPASLLVSLLFVSGLQAAIHATVEGFVTDSETGNPLPGANVFIVGTNLGSVTDLNGKFFIMQLTPGKYIFRASYIGYKRSEKEVDIQGGETIKLNFAMKAEAIQGKTVVVTAQAQGQMGAINQQIASDAIKNIVASDRIQELPEANAAEAVGRLPGVSLQRQGGEGNKVIIRGLEPKFNKVQVEGVNMAATDNWDRSTDLSMISPYMLEGIEVSKTAMADQEADQFGGIVNFKLRGAPYRPFYQAIVQGGYNSLRGTTNDYKIVGQASHRFYSDLIGISANVDVERRNRSSNNVSADYYYLNEDRMAVLDGLNINDISRDFKRYGATLVLDYKTTTTDIKLSNIVSKIDRENVSRTDYTSSLFSGSYGRGQSLTYNVSNTLMMMNTLKAEQYFGSFKLDGSVNYAYSRDEVPEEISYGGTDATALSKPVAKTTIPADLPKLIPKNIKNMLLGRVSDSDSYTKEDEFSTDLNLLWEYRASDQINVKLKTGGNYKQKNRKYDYNELFFSLNEPKAKAYMAILERWPWMGAYFNPSMPKFPFEPFIDKDYDPGDFMAGNYELIGVPDKDLGIELIHHLENSLGINWGGAATPQEFTPDFHASGRNDYHGTENYWAWYLMPTVSIGKKITLIPGVRYEYNTTEYTAVRGNALLMREESQGFIHYDKTFTRKNEFWLPMIHARIKPVQGFDIRASYTQTLSRPSYMEFLPSWYIEMLSIDYKNPKLKPSKSNNFDLQFSVYSNKIGLFSIGGFQKTIEDMIFSQREVILSDSMAVEKYGLTSEATGQAPSKFKSRPIESFVNNPNKVDLWGIETEWQSNFLFLPGLLKNLVLNVNYTHTFSEAKYPRTIPVKEWVYFPFPMEVITKNIDTSYTAPLLYQPDDILNLTLGYDFKGFSIRGSLQYKSDIFSGNNWRPELRGHTDAFTVYDLSLTQKLPLEGLILFGNIKNLTKTIEKDINDGTGYISNEEYYGMTADFGMKYIF